MSKTIGPKRSKPIPIIEDKSTDILNIFLCKLLIRQKFLFPYAIEYSGQTALCKVPINVLIKLQSVRVVLYKTTESAPKKEFTTSV